VTDALREKLVEGDLLVSNFSVKNTDEYQAEYAELIDVVREKFRFRSLSEDEERDLFVSIAENIGYRVARIENEILGRKLPEHEGKPTA
jgi:hypothetical protein